MTIELALTPDARWPFALPELLASAAAAGFTSVGVNGDQVDDDVRGAFAASGLACHEVMALIVGDDEAAAVAAAEQLADCARAVGAAWVLTVFTTPPRAPLIRRCARAIGAAGVAMAAEFSPLGPVSTIDAGMEVVRTAQQGGPAGLLIDSWHFFFGESTWADLAAVPLDDLAYVQFTDALAPESRDRLVRETLHRRALPGDGILELNRFAGTLLDRGYDGIVSLEVLSAALRELPVDDVVGSLYRAGAPFWI
ncbi:TIM barrel protein [Mycobacterium sp. B14F4]|uniref:sugar phosphate isomerase/epimerase family protein n=1 Tax=Mycobacterium sp. B14F4 TaxID=3153565 RepID=UPI00325CC711